MRDLSKRKSASLQLLDYLHSHMDENGYVLKTMTDMKRSLMLGNYEFKNSMYNLSEHGLFQVIRRGIYQIPKNKHQLVSELLYLYQTPEYKNEESYVSHEAKRLFKTIHIAK